MHFFRCNFNTRGKNLRAIEKERVYIAKPTKQRSVFHINKCFYIYDLACFYMVPRNPLYMPLKKEAFFRNHSALRRSFLEKAIFFQRSSWRGTHPWLRILNMRSTSQPPWRVPHQTPLTFYPNQGSCSWVHFKPQTPKPTCVFVLLWICAYLMGDGIQHVITFDFILNGHFDFSIGPFLPCGWFNAVYVYIYIFKKGIPAKIKVSRERGCSENFQPFEHHKCYYCFFWGAFVCKQCFRKVTICVIYVLVFNPGYVCGLSSTCDPSTAFWLWLQCAVHGHVLMWAQVREASYYLKAISLCHTLPEQMPWWAGTLVWAFMWNIVCST